MSIINAPLTVSQLNRQVKGYLEYELGIVHVEGELSNLSKPASGHLYFTLKDSHAQIRCVFFKNRHPSSVISSLCDGQQVVASGRLSLYEARGDYQLIVEQLTEAGLGKLYQQFEALKIKLASEGLFASERKKTIPAMPRCIGVITSPGGAAIRDILSTLERRFPLANVFIYPSEVQGANAARQLINALTLANTHQHCDVLILARGGGSIEDLWAFNNEELARHIVKSSIPVVSGVGHETDFTIADFVADYRAETPTAAATAVTPNAMDLLNLLAHIKIRLREAINRILQQHRLKLGFLIEQISSPHQAIAAYWQTLDYLERQLRWHIGHIINNKKHQLLHASAQLHTQNPKHLMQQTQVKLNHLLQQLNHHIQSKMNGMRHQLHQNVSTLHAVSPLATLERGYAIATRKSNVLITTQNLQIGDIIDIRLAKGKLACNITQIKDQ